MSSQAEAVRLNPLSSHQTGRILVTASAVAWSTAGLFTRLIPLDSWTLLVGRGVFGGLALVLVLACTAAGASAMVCYITSLRYTTVAHVAVIYAVVPFVAGAFAWIFLGERPLKAAVVASLAALGGVAIMAGFGIEGGLLGDVLALAMTVLMAVCIVLPRRFPDIPMTAAASLSALVSAAIAAPFANVSGVSGHDLALLVLFGLVNSALGLTLFLFGSRRLPPIETALIGSLDAPLAPVWVWLVFSEVPTLATLVGGALVFVSVLGHLLSEAIGPAARAN